MSDTWQHDITAWKLTAHSSVCVRLHTMLIGAKSRVRLGEQTHAEFLQKTTARYIQTWVPERIGKGEKLHTRLRENNLEYKDMLKNKARKVQE